MATLGDVYFYKLRSGDGGILMFGGMGGSVQANAYGRTATRINNVHGQLEKAYQAIGDAIIKEQELTTSQAKRLPESSILGPTAEKAFQNYKRLLKRTKWQYYGPYHPEDRPSFAKI